MRYTHFVVGWLIVAATVCCGNLAHAQVIQPAYVAPPTPEAAIVESATGVLNEIMAVPAQGIPRAVARRPGNCDRAGHAQRGIRDWRAAWQRRGGVARRCRQLAAAQLHQHYRRQHRLAGRRAIDRRGAGVQNQEQHQPIRERQVHDRRRYFGRGRAGGTRSIGRDRYHAESGSVFVFAQPRIICRRGD